jgi:hypothetical protein
MKEIENTPLEELQIRAQNLQSVLDVIQWELECVLKEIETLTKRTPIGFKFSKEKDE